MQKRFFKLCSVFMVLILLANMLPMSVFAEAFRESLVEEIITVPEAEAETETALAKDAYIVDELVEKRTEFSKEFLLSNGLRMAAVYADAVHYETENGWEEIDNTLKVNSDGSISNTAGVWEVSFPNQLSSNGNITITKDGYTLSFALDGEIRTSLIRASENKETLRSVRSEVPAQIQKSDLSAQRQSVTHTEMIPEKVQSRLAYTSALQNTDILYDLDSNQVKESIVINSYSNTLRGYRYTLNTGELIPVPEQDGSIHLYDKTQQNVVMTMPAPFLVDANNVFNADVQVQLSGNGGIYTLTYLLPQQWMSAADRAWPVVLDPVVNANVAATNIEDQTVSEKYTPDYTWGMLEAGYSNVWGVAHFYIKYIDLPDITSSDVVVGATIQLCRAQNSATAVQVEAHKVTGRWNSQTVNWSNKPGIDTTIEDVAVVQDAGYYGWVITDVVRQWYAEENNGIAFKASTADENVTSDNYKQFYSSDFGYNKPILTIAFRNNNGLESYWDYTSASAGRAGTGYVNDFTGNMVWVRDDIGFGGNRMPVSISHIYNLNDAIDPQDDTNSNDSANTFGMGYGWRTNFNQLLYRWELAGVSQAYYIWEDSDGTDHYFAEKDGLWQDEDGLELTLTINENSYDERYCITDKSCNCSYFDELGRLTKISNNQQTQSSINIAYYATTHLIIGITDGIGRGYLYMYDNGLLSRIIYRGTGNTEISYVTYSYENGCLITVTDKDGEQCTYEYEGKLLTKATDIDGYRLEYSYTTPQEEYHPYRVQTVSEYDETAGGSLTFSYAHNQTTITDHNDHTQILQFNDFGNTISIQDDKGRAQYAGYAKNTDTDTGKGNQLTVSSKLQTTVGNRIAYSNFEDGDVWSVYPAESYCENVSTVAYLGSHSLLFTATEWSCIMSNYFIIESGATYTFSAWVKGVSGNTYIMIVNRENMSSQQATATNGSTDWQHVQVSYTNTTPSNIIACAQIFGDAGAQIYLDCVQVEKASAASRLNLIENGEFIHGDTVDPYGWDGHGTTSADGLTTVTDTPAPQLENSVYKITGDPTDYKQLIQYVPVSGAAGDSYVLSGWAKGNSLPLCDDREFEIEAVLHHYDGTSSQATVQFNPDSSDWQYGSAAVVATASYHSIAVVIRYNFNANTVYFDGIQLFKEEFGSSFTYNDKGEVISVRDLQGQITDYEYNTSGEITRILQDNKAKMTYEYDDYHNVETATSEEGVSYSFVYDTYGNNTEVSISAGGMAMTSKAYYKDNGNYLDYTEDTLGKVTKYGYDTNTGVLNWVEYPKDMDGSNGEADTRTYYTYDSMYRTASAAVTTDTGLQMSVAYSYTDDLLTAITTPTTTYSFTYGDFSLRSSVKIGSRTLASYDYTDDGDHYLSSLDYGNHNSVEYTYDAEGRLIQERYEDGDTVTYTYDNSGKLIKTVDSGSGITTKYRYDLIDRLGEYTQTGGTQSVTVRYRYDDQNNVDYLAETIGGVWRGTYYTYDEDNRVTRTYTDQGARAYTYDDFGRIATKEAQYDGENTFTEAYTYTTPGEGLVSAQVSGHSITVGSNTIGSYSYTYDNNGNILTISDGTNTTSYVYDSQDQLVRENNQAGGFTHTWTYDNAGNILNRKEYAYTTDSLENATPTDTVTYTYGDSQWGDLLTAYDGTAITYDEIGNPLTDGTWTYTWEHGRELAAMTDGTTSWTFTYGVDGLRTKRTNGAKTYDYVYIGSQLRQMKVGSDTLKFAYDAEGVPLTLQIGDTYYFYLTNLQGDVIGITDSTGTTVVSYTYDAWGNPLSTTGSLASTIGTLNPLRYRGYVFDPETGLYYLQSRYYNPEIGRFLNGDCYAATGQGFVGNNMFAYCGNNPICMMDKCGTDAIYVVDYKFNRGLPIVGHAYVYIEDSNGYWYKTEYAGDIKDKSTAKIYIYPGLTREEVDAEIKTDKEAGYLKSIVITGDFTNSIETARGYAGTNYGGYSFIGNNCLDYVVEVLQAGTPSDYEFSWAIDGYLTGSPAGFYNRLSRAELAAKTRKNVESWWNGVCKTFKNLF